MARNDFDDVHNHTTWGPLLQPASAEEDRLHRHRFVDRHSVPRFTNWEHNGHSHCHRLPDGSWTRPRTDLRPPAQDQSIETLDQRSDRLRREARERTAP